VPKRAADEPDFLTEEVLRCDDAFGAGTGSAVTTTVSDLTGRDPIDLQTFAAKHKTAFGIAG
jgi:hypothetical protein